MSAIVFGIIFIAAVISFPTFTNTTDAPPYFHHARNRVQCSRGILPKYLTHPKRKDKRRALRGLQDDPIRNKRDECVPGLYTRLHLL